MADLLDYPGEWKWAEVDEIPAVPRKLARYFNNALIEIAASSGDEQAFVEAFKAVFGRPTPSTSLDWARSDLHDQVCDEDMTAVVFIDRLYSCLEMAKGAGLKVPSVEQVNNKLRTNGVGYELRPPRLIQATGDAVVASGDAGGAVGIDRYQLGEPLGSGGYGEVFVATRETGAGIFEYALKRLNPHPFIKDPDKARLRFRREVEALKRLQHRGVVPYLDAGFDQEQRPYVVMPRIHGQNIRDHTEGWAPRDCVRLMLDVLAAIGHAHAQQILHRDLKPSNILVRASDGQPIVLDFGNAYIIDELDGASLTTTQAGSLGYIPPEVVADPKRRSGVQDLFACAVITYELIARRQPNHQAYQPLAHSHAVPPALDAVLTLTLGPAENRPATAELLAQLLVQACWPETVSTPSPPVSPP